MSEENIDFTRFKYCDCECGELMSIKDKKGRYRKYIKGHGQKLERNGCWRGGRVLTAGGYWQILCPYHPYSDKRGYVMEHRMVMEEHLKRFLLPEEVVHHHDRNTQNNDISNLELIESNGKHTILHHKKDLSDRICHLCKSNTTYTHKNGTPNWSKYQNGFICNKCYYRIRKKSKILNI